MTSNEKRLLSIFLFLCFTTFLGITFFLRHGTLTEIRGGMSRYEKALAETGDSREVIEQLRKRVAELGNPAGPTVKHTEQIEDLPSLLAYFRESLESEGIRPDRFTISGKEPSQSIEFSLRARPLPFFRFLEKQTDNGTGLLFTYIHMRYIKDSPDYDIVFRISHEK